MTRLVCITVRGRSENRALFVTQTLARKLADETAKLHVLMSEPVPAPLAKIQNQYRFQFMLRTEQIMKLTEIVGKVVVATKWPEDVQVSVDVDALSLL